MNRFSGHVLYASLLTLAVFGASCNEPDKQTAAPGELPSGRLDETPRINATTYFAHGHLLERQGALERAVEQYRKALEIQPDFSTARNRLGITLNRLGRHAEATVEFREAVRQKPDQAFLYNNLGFSLYLEGNYSQAEQAFQRALALKPNFARAGMNLGLTLGRQGRFDEAFQAFRQAGDEVTAYYNLAVVQSETGAYVEAVQALDAALRLNPQYEPAVSHLREIGPLAAQQEQAEQQRNAQLAASTPANTVYDEAASAESKPDCEPNGYVDSQQIGGGVSSAFETGATENLTAAQGHDVEPGQATVTHWNASAEEDDENCDEVTTQQQQWSAAGSSDAETTLTGSETPVSQKPAVVAGAVAERLRDAELVAWFASEYAQEPHNIDWMMSFPVYQISNSELAIQFNELIDDALHGRCSWDDVLCVLETAAKHGGAYARSVGNTN